ncbi:MAG: V-type ATP synthase subunit F [Pleurocapsa sp. SU_196_0]|nr:V-type ATP synthase subunit F [Pleurocapsa sp. SU_196_0]
MATKMAVLTDGETATGFRLAGVEVLEANADTAVKTLEAAIQTNQYGLIAVDESVIADPAKALERAMRGRELPVLLPMPSLSFAFAQDQDAKAYMRELVRSTIGFEIKL